MGNGKSFDEEENIEEGIDTVISKLNGFVGCTGYYNGCKENIYSPMQEILNEFIEIYNNENGYTVDILKKFKDIGSLEKIKEECSDSEDINDYVDIFKDIVENSEKINEIRNCIPKCNECLEDIENLKYIKLNEDSTKEIEDCSKTIDKCLKKIGSLGRDKDKLSEKMNNYKSALVQYNEIINLKLPKRYSENFIGDYSKARNKENDIEAINKFRKYCNEITKNSEFDKLSIESKLIEIRKSLWDDWTKNRCSSVEKKIIDRLYVGIEQECNTGKKDDDGKDIPHKDLTYKYRKIIRNWISCFNKLLASKEDPSDGSRYEKWATLLSYLQALDDNLTYYQNKNKARTKFAPGFYTAKSKIPYTEDDKGNKVLYKEDKQENIIKNEDKKEIKEKIIKSRIEKKMWNVKQQKPYFSVNDVKQGSVGDCWLEATLKSMALKSPKKLLDLFPNHLKEVSPIYGTLLGNQITIKLYDYSEKQKNDDELTTFNPGKIKEMTVDATEINWNRGKAFWPSIIEKAIDKLIEKFHYNESKDYGKQISGNFGAVAHVILTGESSSINKVEDNYKRTLNKLQEALQKSHAPTCGTRSDFGEKRDGKKEKQQPLDPPNSTEVRFLFSGHAYTLKAIHEDKNDISKTKIDLINPWGKKKSEEPKIKDRTIYKNNEYKHYENAVGKDEITVSLDEFIKYFKNIYY